MAAIAAQVGKRFVDLQTTFISPENYEDMIELTNFIEAGTVRPVIDRTLPA